MGDYSSHTHPKRVGLFQKPKKQAQAQNRKRFRAELCRLSFWTRPGFNSLWPEPEPPLSFQVIQSIKTAGVGFLTFMSLGNGLISWHSKNSWAQIFRAWWQYYKNILILKSVLHNHGLFKAWYALRNAARTAFWVTGLREWKYSKERQPERIDTEQRKPTTRRIWAIEIVVYT